MDVEDRMNLSLDDIIKKSKKSEPGGRGKGRKSDPKKGGRGVASPAGRTAAEQKSSTQRQATLAKKRGVGGQQPRAIAATGRGGRAAGSQRGGGRAGGRGQGRGGGRGGQSSIPDLKITINNEKAFQKPKGPPIVYPHQVVGAAFNGWGRAPQQAQQVQQYQFTARQPSSQPASRGLYQASGQVVRRSTSQQLYGPGGYPLPGSEIERRDAPVKRRVPEIPFETPASGSLMRMDQVYHTSNGLKY